MGYAVKYSTSNVNNTFRKGNVVLGVSSEGYEDTDTSGLYAGLPPVAGKHNIVITSASGDPDFYSVDDDGLILLSRNLGQEVDNVNDALLFLSQQDNLAFTDQLPNDTVTDGLVLDLNASNLLSYPTTGSTWYDLSGNNNIFGLFNGPSFNPNGYITTDGVDDFLSSTNPQSISNISGSDPFTFSALFKLTQYANQRESDANNYTSLLMKGAYNPSFGISLWYDLPSGGVHTRARTYSGVRNVSLSSTASGYGNPTQTSNTNFALNRWYQVDFTSEFSGTTYTFKTYVNGNLDITSTSTLSTYPVAFQNSSDLTVSSGPLGGNGIKAPINISKGAVYNKTLSQSEVKQNYYGGPIVTDGLIWNVDAGNLVSYESGSTTINSLTGSIDGTLENGTAFNTSNGGVWEFDGANDFINFPSNSENIISEVTCEAWFKPTGDPLNGYHVIFQKDGGISGGAIYGLRASPGGSPSAMVGWGPNSGELLTTSGRPPGYDPLTIGRWYHLAMTYDSNYKLKLYVDGIYVASGIGTAALYNNSNKIKIGTGDGRYTNGEIASCRVYDRPLLAEEILQNYNAQKNRFI